MKTHLATVLWAVSAMLTPIAAHAETLQVIGKVALSGDLAYADELSGVAFSRGLMIACPDEGAEVNVLRRAGSAYQLLNRVNLLQGSDEEIDMEATTSDARYVYVVGSHSIRRKKVEDQDKYKKNRKRLTRVAPHEMSYRLFRLEFDDDGQLISQDAVGLTEILESDEILAPFCAIPGKENGVDIEGLAIRDGILLVGFRGPVLRGNFVPVLSLRFERPEEYGLKFVQLGGRGIRDMVAVQDGFLILGGPIGDGDSSYQLYLWDGEDCVPGSDDLPNHIVPVGEIPTELGKKPEGIAVMSDNDNDWQLLVLSDGDTRATRWVVPKP